MGFRVQDGLVFWVRRLGSEGSVLLRLWVQGSGHSA